MKQARFEYGIFSVYNILTKLIEELFDFYTAKLAQ